MREIVLAHIPKTAGTSLRNALERQFSDHRHIFDYGRNSPKTSQDYANLIYGNPFLKGYRDALPKEDGVLVSGHFGLKKYWNVFHPSSFIVFIREPVSRLISEYHHFVNNYGYEQSLDAFVENKRFQNVLFRNLAVELEKVGFIGVKEKYDESLAVLSKRLGRKIQSRRDNVGKTGTSETPLADDQLLAKIKRINRDDIDLYHYLVEEVVPANWERVDCLPSPCRVAGHVRTGSDGGLDGVAYDLGQTAIVNVDIELEGRKLLTVPADLFSPDLHVKKRVRSGIGRFAVSADRLITAGADIGAGKQVRVSALGRELHGSPVWLEAPSPQSVI